LWQNNVLFERVVEDYLDWLAHPTLDRGEIRSILDDVEAANARSNGYGARAFLANLAETFQRLHARPVKPEEQQEIEQLATALLRHDIELMPGVGDVLEQLGSRHDLYLLTKGDRTEQNARSSLRAWCTIFWRCGSFRKRMPRSTGRWLRSTGSIRAGHG